MQPESRDPSVSMVHLGLLARGGGPKSDWRIFCRSKTLSLHNTAALVPSGSAPT